MRATDVEAYAERCREAGEVPSMENPSTGERGTVIRVDPLPPRVLLYDGEGRHRNLSFYVEERDLGAWRLTAPTAVPAGA